MRGGDSKQNGTNGRKSDTSALVYALYRAEKKKKKEEIRERFDDKSLIREEDECPYTESAPA